MESLFLPLELQFPGDVAFLVVLRGPYERCIQLPLAPGLFTRTEGPSRGVIRGQHLIYSGSPEEAIEPFKDDVTSVLGAVDVEHEEPRG